MRAKGMLHANKGLTVFVASGSPGDHCPRAVLNRSKTRFRDDYYGNVKIPKVLSKALFQ